jgi:hypothetical protein
MQQTISQLSETNKQLEEEKSSLVTAIKIIQSDFNQQATRKRKAAKQEKRPVVALMIIRGENLSQSIKARG